MATPEEGPLPEAWQALARTVPNHVRRAAWESLASASAQPDFVAANAAEVCRLVLQSLGAYTDAPTQRAILTVVRHCLKSQDFVKEFTAGLVRAEGGRPAPGTAGTLLRWSSMVLAHLDVAAAGKAVTKLVECQAGWLAALAATGQQRGAAQHAAAAALAAKPELLDAYVTAAASKASAPLVQLIWSHAAKRPAIADVARPKLLQIFVDAVLSAKERPADATLACYARLLRDASSEDVTAILLPAALRMIRRSPEAALGAASFMLRSLGADLSASAAEVMPVLVQQARHAKEPVRRLAVEATAALAGRLEDPAAVQASVDVVRKTLDGTEAGKIKSAQERASLAAALEALAAAPGRGAGVAAAAASAAEFAAAFYKEEITEEGKLALLRALGAWLPRCTALPPAVLNRMEEGLKEKEALRRGHLRALARALSTNAELRAPAAPLAPALAKLVNEGAAKVAARLDGILALLCAAYVAWADAGADGELDKSGAWSAGAGAESPLIAATTVSKLPPEDAAVAAELCGALLALHPARLGGDGSAATAATSRSLVLLLLHYSPDVRSAASNAASAVSKTGAAPVLALLEALQSWVSTATNGAAVEGTAAGVLQDPAEGEVPMALEAVHERYLHALLACLPPKPADVPPAPAVIAATLLISHHPMVAAARRGGSSRAGAWHTVSRRMGDDAVEAVIAAEPAAIVAGIVAALQGSDPLQLTAAYGALAAAAAVDASALFVPVMEALAPFLERSAHDALTARQLRIYATPRGRTSNENEDGSIIPVELFEEMLTDKAAIKPPVFPPPAEAPAAEEPAAASAAGGKPAAANGAAGRAKTPAVRPSVAAAAAAKGGKPMKGPAKDAAAEARARQLKTEAEVRAGVVAIRETLAKGLTALGAFGSGNPAFTAANLADLAAPALPLLTSPLVGAVAAFDCVRQLAGCIPGAPGWRALDVAAALRLVAIADDAAAGAGTAGAGAAYQHLAGQRCVESSVGALLAATGGRPATEIDPVLPGTHALPGPTYNLCFPILRAVLSCPHPTPLHDAALSVVALHVGPDSSVPQAQAFELLYHVLEILPGLRDRVQRLLRVLCSSVAPGDDASLIAALRGIVSPHAFARAAALAALEAAPPLNGGAPTAPEAVALLWMAGSDVNEDNAAAGKALWERSGAVLPPSFVPSVIAFLPADAADVRAAAAGALAAGVATHPSASTEAVSAATGLYAAPGAPRAARLGAAATLAALAPHLPTADVTAAMDFLLCSGLVDNDSAVRQAMVAAGVAIVDAAGPTPAAGPMLPLFDSYLESKVATGGLTEEQYDHVRQGAVVFLGTLARHLDPTNPKVKSIVDTLCEVLTTPSEAVQRSVSDCLPPLVKALEGDAAFIETTVKRLLQRALAGETYGDRRGAAYGLAGAVKGLGLSVLKTYGIMDALKAGVEDKGNAAAREGALCAFECLSDKLGRLFEPYVVSILATLLEAFGDASPAVRDAANGASRVIMGQLSAQGVKLVLPKLLQGVDARVWRTKQGSIQLLGAMAHCAPKQLSVALPTIVPRLGEVLADPHPKVCAAARQALDEVGSVIRNPEVARLVPTLLAAVADPNKNNKAALDTLLSTVFVNTVDAASLALIVPVVHRGLRDRSGDVKKRAARIVGNLCKLVNDPKDMAPYVPLLLPEVQSALVDPLPEVRATAAKALGALTVGMGAEALGDTEPWLLERMHSEASAVERSGAAQGLAEVLAVQGAGALEAVLPQVIEGCSARSAAAREGSLTLFKYLPYAAPDAFRPHLPDMLPCVLDGLADESEGVRDAALSAGRVAVELYSSSALPLLLPTVEAGTANFNWRIRQSSIELLGDLLFKVAGTTGRIQQDVHDDDTEGISVEAHGAAIIDALGMDKRNEVLARIYAARSDVAYTVRSAALHVWKTLVVNTPKTLGELLPSLMELVISGLASGDEDRAEAAGRCLGELVRKMGDRVLSQILPILRQGVTADEAATRAGVCLGLREVMENSTRHQLAEHLADLLPAVQGALCDEDADVRAAAGGVLDVLFKSGGGAAIDSVIPSLLQGLDSRDEGTAVQALEGLRVVLGVRPQLLSAMAPKLVAAPVAATNLKALGALAEVAGAAIHGHLAAVMPALLAAAGDARPEAAGTSAAASAALSSISGALQDDGVYLFIGEAHKGLDEGGARRAGAAVAISAFCKVSKLDYQEHVPGLISSLVPLLTEENPETLAAVWAALSSVMASIPKDMAPSFVRTLKEAVAAARERARRKARDAGDTGVPTIPGFCLPKALTPVLPVYLQGVLQGSSAELRELAAEGLGELIEVTGEDTLKPFVVQITGPLIRIIGDRFPWQTKAAILKTMGLLVARAGVGLRPFIPQLQSTFLKCLSDPAQGVRQRAAKNLGELTKMALRLDQLVSDLAAGAATAKPGIAEAYLTALEGALVASGDRLTPETLQKVGAAARSAAETAAAADDEVVLRAAAGAVGTYAALCGEAELREVLEAVGPLAPAQTGKYGERLGAALVAAAVAHRAGGRLDDAGLRVPFLQATAKLTKDEGMEVKMAAGKAAGRIAAVELDASSGATSASLPGVSSIIVALLGPDQHSEVQKQALGVLRRLAGAGACALVPHYPDLVPSLLAMVQDSSGTTKLSAERTLARVLQLDQGPEAAQAYLAGPKPGALAKQMMTEAYCRRLARLPALEEDDLAEYAI